jgi:regulator of sigma D
MHSSGHLALDSLDNCTVKYFKDQGVIYQSFKHFDLYEDLLQAFEAIPFHLYENGFQFGVVD